MIMENFGRALFFICLLMLTVGAVPGFASAFRVTDYSDFTDLRGSWKITNADDARFKDVGTDEQSWMEHKVPFYIYGVYPPTNRIFWLRFWVQLPEKHPEKQLAIMLNKIDSADETYVNGKLIGKTGTITEPFIDAYDRIRIYELPQSLLRYGQSNLIAIRIRTGFSIQSSGGLYQEKIGIGYLDRIRTDYFSKEAASLVLSTLYFFMGIYFLFFFIQRPRETEKMYFCLFLFLFAAYTFFTSQWKHIIGMDFSVSKRLEYAISFILAPFFLRFLYEDMLQNETGRFKKNR